MLAVSVAEKPLSPVHVNVSVPLSVATVENAMNGFAAMAGCSSARKTSTPLYAHTNWRMRSRGTAAPRSVRR
jgi:hypothetical protein